MTPRLQVILIPLILLGFLCNVMRGFVFVDAWDAAPLLNEFTACTAAAVAAAVMMLQV